MNRLFFLCLATLLLSPAWSMAQSLLQIVDVRVGFPQGSTDFIRGSRWHPIYVTLAPPKNQALTGDFKGEITIECQDSDGWRSRMVKQNVNIARQDISGTFLSYIKLTDANSDIEINVRGKVGESNVTDRFSFPRGRLSPFVLTQGESRAIAPNDLAILDLGSSRVKIEGGMQEDTNQRNYYSGQREAKIFTLEKLSTLPDSYLGYDALDIVVIATGGTWSNSIAQQLGQDSQRREALERWIFQGGQLVITVAGNSAQVFDPKSFPLANLLPATLEGKDPMTGSGLKLEAIVKTDKNQFPKALETPLARLKPKPGTDVLEAFYDDSKTTRPWLVRTTYGLGRITLIGFDTNTKEFNNWSSATDMWTKLFDFEAKRQRNNNYGYGGYQYDVANDLMQKVDTFGGVQVISFALVAMFIAGYILIIGPIDYFFHKKITKRLELTWITFPLVVLAISLAAYFGAYYIKGSDLRINKVDLLDVDMARNRIAGTSWYAIFSPRLQGYQVKLEPRYPGAQGEVTMDMSSLGRRLDYYSQAGGIFDRSYTYSPKADAIQDLPIQVWSTKSLMANWQQDVESSRLPVKSELKRKEARLMGKLTSQLAGPLHNAKLLYKDSVYNLGTIQPGASLDVDAPGIERTTLTSGTMRYFQSLPKSSADQTDFAEEVGRILFTQVVEDNNNNPKTNLFFQRLNQTWRINRYPEAVLVGTLEDTAGQAEDMVGQVTLGTKLSLTDNQGNNLMRGKLRQSTFLRVFIPVE